jgi:hypothetical protein
MFVGEFQGQGQESVKLFINPELNNADKIYRKSNSEMV